MSSQVVTDAARGRLEEQKRSAARDFLKSAVMPLIEEVLVKKFCQTMDVISESSRESGVIMSAVDRENLAIGEAAQRLAKLQAECEALRSIISDLKDWDCDVSGGFLSIPLDLRRRMQEAIAAHRKQQENEA